MRYLWLILVGAGCGSNEPAIDANPGKPVVELTAMNPVVANQTVDILINATGTAGNTVVYRMSSPVGGFAPASPDDFFVIDPTGAAMHTVSWMAPVAPVSTNVAIEASYSPTFANATNDILDIDVVSPFGGH